MWHGDCVGDVGVWLGDAAFASELTVLSKRSSAKSINRHSAPDCRRHDAVHRRAARPLLAAAVIVVVAMCQLRKQHARLSPRFYSCGLFLAHGCGASACVLNAVSAVKVI